ncbi:thiamine pyrophosphate-dependent enzyme [Thermodesulfobacterium hydrogeniphilum]|uniref:thiamine pyrophosphate-dependent enzyme n=1 Tax=Thermodesulfobacterium hydrogeniphilum TaxID=161156 RepID=UPI00056ED968|nr:thiamine pyrophosphate-dependent enzyme [Thermodesulfobacterium hydrogeniphilum]
MLKFFEFPKSLKNTRFHYCPGCHHSIAHRLLCEVIDELGIQDKSLGIASIGCSCFLYFYIDVDIVEAPHGRACAAATGAKRARPDLVVFTYQGDGDFASIGFNESFHTALRGEKITAIMINNTVYGMTGGQASPTTVPGQKTTTTPEGKDPQYLGYPPKIAEILATLESVAFSARVALNTPKRIIDARKAIKNAFLAQINNLGFGYVEILSACPINWKMDPVSANKHIDKLTEIFPLGIFKDKVSESLKSKKGD